MKIKTYTKFFCAFSTVLLLLLGNKSNAQIANYIFTQSTSTYVPITVGFVLGDATTNDQFFTDPNLPLGGTNTIGAGLPIGFNFTYNDTVYDKFGICANGWIILGNGSVDFSNANLNLPLSSGIRKVISGFGRDLEAQTNSSLSYASLGTAPNRVLIVQWDKYARFNNVSPDSISFQIRLNEADNSISFVYGKVQTGSTQTNLTQAGIKGATAADINLRTTNLNWNTTTAATVNTAGCTFNATIFPSNGLTFTWLPPLPCVAPPTAGTASVGTSSSCSALQIVSLTGNSIGVGISFQWLVSNDSLNWSPINGAISNSYSVNQLVSNYYRCVITCSGSTDSSNVVLVSGTSSAVTCYCNTNLHANAGCQGGSINDLSIIGTSFSNLASGCAGLNGNSYTNYLDTGSYTTNLFAGLSYTFNVTTTGNGTVSLWIDYNQNGLFDASEWTQLVANAVANTPYIVTVNIPLGAAAGKTGMRIRYRLTGGANAAGDACTQNFGSGETEDYLITIDQQAPCVAPPTAGFAVASDSSVCAGVSYTVSLNGATSGSGISFVWESSSDSITWSTIIGATTNFYTTSQTQSTYYRCIITCSGSSDTSTVVLVAQNSLNNCYCTSSASNAADTDIGNVSFGSLNNGVGTPATQNPAANGLYTDYSALPAQPFTQNTSYPIAITQINSANFFTARVSVFIDYNQNGLFTDAGESVFTGTTANGTGGNVLNGNVLIPATAIPGNTRMRVVMIEAGGAGGNFPPPCSAYQFGETEDYTVDIIQQLPCVAPPTAGLAVASDSTVCSAAFTLSLSGSSAGAGMSYEWQFSLDSLNWSAIAGATNTFYSATQSISTYYRCILTCSGLSDTSSVVFVFQNAATNCYCTSTANQNTDTDIGNVSFGNLNNGVGTPATNNVAANGTYTDYTALPVQQFTQNTAYPIAITQINSANFFTARVSVFIDYNQNGLFTDAGESVFTGTSSNVAGGNVISGNVTISATATAGNTRMRVVMIETGGGGTNFPPACSTYQWGETEDYTVEIVQQLPCVAPPTAGLAQATDSSVCAIPFQLSLLGASSGVGMTYEWQSSTDSVSWSAIVGATNTFYAATQTQSTYYRCILTCSGLNDTSSAVYVMQNLPTLCYCTSSANSVNNGDIGNVTFGSLNNGTATPITNNPAATATYTNFTALPAQIFNQSTAYPISIAQINSANSFQGTVTVFIDYNQNGSFADAGESVFTGNTTNGNNIASGSVTIPPTATLGNTRMRVILAQGGIVGTQNPCGNYQFGETEDYTVTIDVFNAIKNVAQSNINIAAFPNPTGGKTVVSYAITQKSKVEIGLYNLVGEKVKTLLNDTKAAGVYTLDLDIQQLQIQSGIYFLTITNAGVNKTIRLVVN